MKLFFLFVLCCFPAAGPLPAQSPETVTPGPLEVPASEFPLWARDLRRAEIVAFGAVPFTVFFSLFAMDTYRWSVNDWDNRYAPWPLKAAGAVEMSTDQKVLCFSVGVAGALVISLADHLIIRARRAREARKLESLPPGDPIIIRRIPETEEAPETEASPEEEAAPEGE